MVDSNLHREHLLPSEKAFAYKLKLEAMKQQGMYYDGIFVQEDYSQAFKYFKKASDKSDIEALRVIGTMYFEGLGVPKDEKCAFDNFWKAAYYGDLESQRTVGEMLIHGIGVAADEGEGVKWLEKAARGGDEEAKKFWKKEEGHQLIRPTI